MEVTPKSVVEDDKTDDTNKPVVEDDKTDDTTTPVDNTENPKTDANSNLIFISILALISVASVYGVKRKMSK